MFRALTPQLSRRPSVPRVLAAAAVVGLLLAPAGPALANDVRGPGLFVDLWSNVLDTLSVFDWSRDDSFGPTNDPNGFGPTNDPNGFGPTNDPNGANSTCDSKSDGFGPTNDPNGFDPCADPESFGPTNDPNG